MIIKLVWIKWRTNKCRVRNPELILKLFVKSTENDKRFIDIPLMKFETDLNCLIIKNRPMLIAINDCWGFGKIALKWSETLKYSDAGNDFMISLPDHVKVPWLDKRAVIKMAELRVRPIYRMVLQSDKLLNIQLTECGTSRNHLSFFQAEVGSKRDAFPPKYDEEMDLFKSTNLKESENLTKNSMRALSMNGSRKFENYGTKRTTVY